MFYIFFKLNNILNLLWSNLFFTVNNYFLYTALIILVKIICILISVAYFTIAERKIMASIQRRLGPNVEGGPFGILQPLADGLKLFIKELVIPGRANIFIFFLAPVLIFTLSLLGWSVIPFYYNPNFLSFQALNNNTEILFNIFKIADNNYGILFLLAISSLNVYGIILGGWASNSKYAFLGALRSAAQMISYEVSISLTILPVILLTGSFNFFDIMFIQQQTCWFLFPLLPCAIIFFISMLAETNRAPFDLPEAEAELVAGYNVEYSSMAFALFFLGEYSSMLLMASFSIILFYGGFFTTLTNIHNLFIYLSPIIFAIKIIFFAFLYILVRAAFPRYRYDQLMHVGWKILLPIVLSFFIFIVGLITLLNCAPAFNETFSFLNSSYLKQDNCYYNLLFTITGFLKKHIIKICKHFIWPLCYTVYYLVYTIVKIIEKVLSFIPFLLNLFQTIYLKSIKIKNTLNLLENEWNNLSTITKYVVKSILRYIIIFVVLQNVCLTHIWIINTMENANNLAFKDKLNNLAEYFLVKQNKIIETLIDENINLRNTILDNKQPNLSKISNSTDTSGIGTITKIAFIVLVLISSSYFFYKTGHWLGSKANDFVELPLSPTPSPNGLTINIASPDDSPIHILSTSNSHTTNLVPDNVLVDKTRTLKRPAYINIPHEDANWLYRRGGEGGEILVDRPGYSPGFNQDLGDELLTPIPADAHKYMQ